MAWYSRNECRCSSCLMKIDCYDSPMLKNSVWEAVSNEHYDKKGKWVSQIICLPCIEKSLGRKLEEDDLMLMGGDEKRHVPWNRKFVMRNFPVRKYKIAD